MAWLPDGEKKFEAAFIRFDTIYECDGRTSRQTHRQTLHDGIASRGNCNLAKKLEGTTFATKTSYSIPQLRNDTLSEMMSFQS